MSQQDLTPIRERLETLKQTTLAVPSEVPEPWQSAHSPKLPTIETGDRRNEPAFTATLEALQARSAQARFEQTQSDQVPPESSGLPSRLPATAPPEAADALLRSVALHWQRLQQEAALINDLGQKQTIAVQNFKRSADSLAWSLRKQPMEYGLTFDQFCELGAAAIPQVVQDAQGKLVLSTTSVDLYQDERCATETAKEIRAFSRSRLRARPPATSGRAALSAAFSTLKTAWGTLKAPASQAPVTAMDVGLWFGGGLIGRLALELVLAVSPVLWPLVIGAMVGIVALALYRLLLIPRPDIAFVMRLLLALIGLALGGQF